MLSLGASRRLLEPRRRLFGHYGVVPANVAPVAPSTVRIVNALFLQFVRSMIEYLIEEKRVLRELLGKRRVRLTGDQRRRLAMGAKALGRAELSDMAGIVAPDTPGRICSHEGRRPVLRRPGPGVGHGGRARVEPALSKIAPRGSSLVHNRFLDDPDADATSSHDRFVTSPGAH